MTIDLTQIIQAVIALIAALITYKLIPWIKARTTEAQQRNLEAAARIAAYAAEQLYGAGQGAEKLEYALAAMRKAGFDLDKEIVREAIESAVYSIWTVEDLDFPPEEEEAEAEVEEKAPPDAE